MNSETAVRASAGDLATVRTILAQHGRLSVDAGSLTDDGDMYYAGQTIYGAKILKVGADYIIGECKGKRFKKGL